MKKQLFLLMLLAALIVPWASRAQSPLTVLVGDSTSTTTNYTLPTNTFYNYSLTRTIVVADEMAGPMNISSISYLYGSTSVMTHATGVKIYLMHTDKEVFSSNVDFEPAGSLATLVYTGSLNCTNGWNTVTLTTSFDYDGESNLMILVLDTVHGYDGNSYKFTTSDCTGNKSHALYSDTNVPSLDSPTSFSSKSVYTYRPVMMLEGTELTNAGCRKVRDLHFTECTSSSLTFSWTDTINSGATYDIYMIGATDTTLVESGVTTTSYYLGELDANTTYTVGVVANCGGGDEASMRTISARTLCDAVATDSLPYIYGFEDASASGAAGVYSPCWGRHVIGTTSDYPYPSSSYKHNGTYSLYYYASSSIRSWSTLPQFENPISDLQITFWMYSSTASTTGAVAVGVMSDPEDLTTFDTIAIVTPSATSTWEFFDIPLSGYTGNGTYIALQAINYGSSTKYFYLDDITVDLMPTCPRPTELVVINAAANSVELGWTDNAVGTTGFIVEYGLHGFIQGTGTTIDDVSTNSVTIENLTMGMPYDVYVMAVCGDDTSTIMLGQVTAGCAAITEDDLPFTENFEAYGTGSAYGISSCWAKGTTATTAFPYPYSTAAINGIRGLYFYGYTSGTTTYYSWAAMPPVDESLTMSELMVRFNVKRYSTVGNTYTSILYVGVADSVSPFSAADVVWVDTIDLTATPASSTFEIEVPFDQYDGDGRYVVFYAPNPYLQGTSSSGNNYIYLDDVALTRLPSCFRPTALGASNVGVDEATLVWTPDERTTSPNSWVVEYGPHGFTLGDGTVVTASDTTYTLTDLTANTWYDVYVSADCGDDVSDTRSFNFVTSSVPAELPYFCGFEEDQDTSWVLSNLTFPNYWIYGEDSTAVRSGSRALYITNNGTDNTYTVSSAISTVFAIRPLVLDEAGQYAVSFDWKAYGESTWDYLRAFLVPSNITIVPGEMNGISPTATPEGWINLGSYNGGVKLNLSSSWQNNLSFIDIDEDEAGIYNLVFFWRNDNSSGTMPPASIDNVEVRKIVCFAPTDLAVVNIGINEVEMAWQGEADSYEVQYDTTSSFDTPGSVTTTDTTATVTGLNEYSQYYFRVRGICADDTSFWSNIAAAHTLVNCGADGLNILDTLTTGVSASSGSTYTFYASTTYRRAFTAAIFTAEELNSMGLQQNNRINSISLHTGATGGTIRQGKIYMKEVSLDAWANTPVANDTIDRNTMTLVKSGDLTFTASSWNEIELDSTFAYSGNNPLMIMFAHDTTSTAAVSFYYASTTPDYRNIYSYMTSTGTTFSAPTRSYMRPDIAFNICTEVPPCLRPSSLVVTTCTDTSATLAWNAASSAYEVMLSTTSVNPDSATGVATYTVTTNPTTINGLMSNTTYYWYVRSICSDNEMSEWSIEGTFTTACAPMPLPYTEDFESYASGSAVAISPCWVKGTNGSTAYPYPYSTNPINGQRSLYFYGYYPSSATSTLVYSYAALPMMQDSVKNLMLSFYVRTHSTATSYYVTNLVVGVMDNPNDIATFTGVDTINLEGAPALSIHGVDVSFANYTGDGKYIAILDPVPTLSGSNTYAYSYAYVDDIVVDHIPTCMRPSNVTVSNVASNTATVHWTSSATNFEVEYGPHGFAHGTGTIVTATADSVDISGLAVGEEHDVYVRAICSATDASPWSYVHSFYTECGAMTLPYAEDFESYGSGSSMTIHPCWTKSTNSSTAYPYPYSTAAINGNRGLYFYSYHPSSGTSSYYCYAALPEFDAPVNTLEISFNMKRYSSAGNNYTSMVVVGVMTDPTDINTFTTVDTIDLQSAPTSSIHELTVSLASYTDTGKYIALYAPVPPLYGTGTYTYNYVYIDDIYVDVLPHCPRVYDLTATNGTATTVELGWTDTIGSSQWVIEYGVLGSETTTTVNATSVPFTLTGLTSGTNYRFHVAPICADGQQSEWSRDWLNFSTALNPATLPYTYDFNAATEWANWQTSSSSTTGWYQGNVAQGNTTGAMYLSADGGLTHSWNMNARTNAVAYRDIDFGTTPGSFQIDFDAYIGGTIEHNYDGISIIVTDPATYVESQDVNLTSPWGSVNEVSYGTVRHDTLWGSHTIYIDNISGVKRVAFYHFNQATGSSSSYEDNPSAIDNVSITAQPCARPYDLDFITSTTNSATVSWIGDASATYLVAYRVKGAAASTNAYITVTGTTATITPLPAATNYYYWVSKICSLTATDTLASAWSVTGEFATLCDVVSVADTLFENFENYTGVVYNSNDGVLPNCWEGYNAGNTYTPHITNGSTYSYCISGTNAVTMTSGTNTSYTGGTDNYMRLVDIVEPTNSLTVAFWMCTESSTNGFLEVGYLTGLNYATDFVAVKRINASSATVHSGNGLQDGHGIFDTVSFDSVPAGNYPICFRWNYTTSYYSVCLDDIAVWSNNTCVAPTVAVSDITAQSATVTASGSGINFELQYGTANGEFDNSLTNTTGVFNLSGLQPETQYFFSVRQQCDSASFSPWYNGTFTTDELGCMPPTGLNVTATGYTDVTLGWVAGNEETAWEIHVFSTTIDTIVPAAATTAVVSGLAADLPYSASVRALCGVDSDVPGPWSDTVNFTTLACQAITDVTVNAAAVTATVSWTGTSASYRVIWGLQPFNPQDLEGEATVTTNSYTITGLDPEADYAVVVYNNCAEGVSVPSLPVNFSTTEASGTLYTVTVTANNPAWGTVSGGGQYEEGANATITATANEGYHFVEWNDHNTDNPRTFTVTSDMSFVATFEADETGIGDVVAGTMSLYPNPASTNVTLGLEGFEGEVIVDVVDMNGRVVYNANTTSTTVSIDVREMPQGAYFVRVTSGSRTAVSKLIVK